MKIRKDKYAVKKNFRRYHGDDPCTIRISTSKILLHGGVLKWLDGVDYVSVEMSADGRLFISESSNPHDFKITRRPEGTSISSGAIRNALGMLPSETALVHCESNGKVIVTEIVANCTEPKMMR